MRVVGQIGLISVCLVVCGWGCGPQASPDKVASSAGPGGHKGHGIKDVDAYIAMLERQERAQWQKPDEVISALGLKAGEQVADVGAGSGYFTIPLARAVGANGAVWAVDVEQKMLDYLAQRARAEKLDNIRLVLAPEDDPLLPAGRIDTILIVNTYHHFPDRAAYVRKLRTALAPGGRVVNIDFIPKPREERGFGPRLEVQLARDTVDAEMAEAGLKPVRAHDFLPEQYFVEYGAE
jgi:ubiquinone/menaquinone biosynthesis C-methylase UbiE